MVRTSFLTVFESRLNVDRQSRLFQRFLNHLKPTFDAVKATSSRSTAFEKSHKLNGWGLRIKEQTVEENMGGPGQLVNLDLARIIKLFEACFGCSLFLFRFQEARAASLGHSRPFQK